MIILKIINRISKLMFSAYEMLIFSILLIIYIFSKTLEKIYSFIPLPFFLKQKLAFPFSFLLDKLVGLLDRKHLDTISKINLIELSIKNMRAKKARTIVTVGGMVIGISAIVFLVSIGYGLQNLVITRVARLDEMKQAEITPQAGSQVKIDDKTLNTLKEIQNIDKTLPMIALVSRVNFQNSISDLAVYGVTTDYLEQSAIKPIEGEIFKSDDIYYDLAADENTKQTVLVTTTTPELTNTTNPDSTTSPIADIIVSDSNPGWVEIKSESDLVKPADTKTIELKSVAKRQAVVSVAMLKLLGLETKDSIGKKFDASFIVVGALNDTAEKIESAPSEYTIVGVIPDEQSAIFYVPFLDLRSLGITNYSQLKILVKSQSDLPAVRTQIENLGFVSTSAADTVEQINSIFTTARLVLAIVGMVALSVATLGMFNTLTVSLLERTREVGLMKAMGMKSTEVQELFLTESMIMGFTGGVFGIALGWGMGKAVSLALSSYAIFSGIGYLDITYVPPTFIIAIIILSIFVGVVTGIYPARRATKISALNALRYE